MDFDWNRARAFLVTAQEGSLSAAARALGLTQPTLGRQVDGLEQELGVVLFERVGRGLKLTPAGAALLPHVQKMGEAAQRLALTAHAQTSGMTGEVVIAASDAYAGLILPPIIARLRAAEPRISIAIAVSNDPADLLGREADIAIRNFRPTEPDLVARKIRDAHARLYGAADYLDRLGPVRKPADLAQAQFIGLDETTVLLDMFNGFGLGLTEDNFPIRCANFLVMWNMVKQGLGIGILDDRIGDGEPGVRRALPDLPGVPFPVWLVAHREIHHNQRQRFVFDFLADALR